MTPGGKFTDVRARTVFAPGLAHIAGSVSGVALLPVAIEYVFWEERTPEALIEFGSPTVSNRGDVTKKAWQRELEDRLAATQASLAQKAIAHNPDQFDVLLDGSAGIGGWYDLMRRYRALLTGSTFNPRHGRSRSERSYD